jgi:hypothetical protein
MLEKLPPMFHLFNQQYKEARNSFNALGKNFKSRKALELEDRLIFLNIYLQLLSKIHFKEERLKFESFGPFKTILKSLKRIHHYKLAMTAFEEEKRSRGSSYNTYENFLAAEKKELYKKAYEGLVSAPLDIWEELYITSYHYSKGVSPLMINTATTQLINEEIEDISVVDEDLLDSQSIRDLMEGLRIIHAVENINISLGLNPFFIPNIHLEMKALNQLVIKWHQTHLFAQHLNFFLGENDQVATKYLDMAKRTKIKKQRLTKELANLCMPFFSKLVC